MEKAYLIKQLELYSNTIISFVVLQGLIFCYNFGTNELFNSSVKCKDILSVSLVLLFMLTMVGGAFANSKLGEIIILKIDSEHADLIAKIYKAKFYVIVYFGTLPAVITLLFGVLQKCP